MKIEKSDKYTIGLFIDSLLDNYQTNIWKGIIDKAHEYGLNLITYLGGKLKTIHFDYIQRNYIFEIFDKKRIDGIIILSSSICQDGDKEDLLKFLKKYSSIPIINLGFYLDEYPSIYINNEKSMRELVEHFVVFHNYKKIVFITGPKMNNESRKRLKIYKDVLRENNRDIDEKLIIEGNFLPLSATKAIIELVDDKKISFDALIAANDYMAIKALKELQKRGYKIPGDIAVGGFDNIAESIYCTPQLTTVNQSPYRMGREAVINLHNLLEGIKIDNKIEIQSKLIVRYSCGCTGHSFSSVTYRKLLSVDFYDSEDKFLEFYIPVTNNLIQENLIKIIDINKINNWSKIILKSIYKSIKFKNTSIFLHKLEGIIQESINDVVEIIIWNDILIKIFSTVKEYNDAKDLESLNALLFKSIELVKGKILKADKEIQFETNYKEWQSMKLFFSGIYTVKQLKDFIISEFKLMNIPTVFLSLFEKDIKKSSLKIAYRNSKNLLHNIESEIFTTSEIFPRKYEKNNKVQNYIVMMLFNKEKKFGFIVYEVGSLAGKIYEILTLQISGIINQIKMFEKINEYTKTLEEKLKERTLKLENANKKIEEKNKEILKLDKKLKCINKTETVINEIKKSNKD